MKFQSIWKEKLDWSLSLNKQTISLPIGAEVLSVAFQGKDLCIWFINRDLSKKGKCERGFWVYTTGAEHDIIEGRYLGTVQCEHIWGTYVMHVFTEV